MKSKVISYRDRWHHGSCLVWVDEPEVKAMVSKLEKQGCKIESVSNCKNGEEFLELLL